ncbi:MAG TPA: DUF2520 domain-containing protein [Pyrinomonadaceae bacterium]|nr:DUF2520 domain-containing protein [Pyrinomonadaceae bacterium]
MKPTISIIGAGRIGHALGLALKAAEYPIAAVVTKTASHAKNAAASIGLSTLALSADELTRLPPSDIVLICTPDDAIESVAKRLVKTRPGAKTIFLHTSGALPAAVLAPLANAGFSTGSMHPLVSISDPIIGANVFRGAFFCLERDATGIDTARELVKDLGGESFTISAEMKPLYHAAAVMASPHLVSLFDLAVQMLAACGVKPKRAHEILVPLVETTFKNLKVSDTEHSLTGTFARGDVETIERHLQALRAARLSEAEAVYRLLGEHSLELGEKNGLDPKLVKEIRKQLSTVPTIKTKPRRSPKAATKATKAKRSKK